MLRISCGGSFYNDVKQVRKKIVLSVAQESACK